MSKANRILVNHRMDCLGCLSFTRTNRLVHGLDKWLERLRTSKLLRGVAFIIILHKSVPFKNGREGLRLELKMVVKKWNSNFRLEHSVRKNRTVFSDVPLLPESSRWNNPKSRVPCTFQLDFPETFCIIVNNLTVLYIPVTSSRTSACFNTAVSTEEAGVRVLAVGGETKVFVVVVAGCRL